MDFLSDENENKVFHNAKTGWQSSYIRLNSV